jgi:hypothetical protein
LSRKLAGKFFVSFFYRLVHNGWPPAAGADLLVALISISFQLLSKPVDSSQTIKPHRG